MSQFEGPWKSSSLSPSFSRGGSWNQQGQMTYSKSHSCLLIRHKTKAYVLYRQYCIFPPVLLQNRSSGCWIEGGRSSPPSPFLCCAPSFKDVAPDYFSKYLLIISFATSQHLLFQPNQTKLWGSHWPTANFVHVCTVVLVGTMDKQTSFKFCLPHFH